MSGGGHQAMGGQQSGKESEQEDPMGPMGNQVEVLVCCSNPHCTVFPYQEIQVKLHYDRVLMSILRG